MPQESKTVVLIPCYNEEVAILKVIENFKLALPYADIYVFDNNSIDRTVQLALAAGVYVRNVSIQGKGNVVRRMFADIDADAYVLVDGDGTYDASSAPQMIAKVLDDGFDMVVAKRKTLEADAYRLGHQFGNWLLTEFVARLFGRSFSDILSGYRVFSRRYVKSFPALASGFEIETELTVHALELRMPICELDSNYFSRPDGSFSKLNTYRDGFRILFTIFNLFRVERPLMFFGIVGIIMILISCILSYPIVLTFIDIGLVPRIPTVVLSTGLSIVGVLSIFCGLILETVSRGRHELKKLMY
jgi:glycosyltransferase involved in cell wall biosynthesis